MAGWALALQQPSAMAQARWATHWSPWRLPLVAQHDSSLQDQITRAPFSTTLRWSVGAEVALVSWVRVQSPTSVIRVRQLLLQHPQSIWARVAPHLHSARAMRTRAQFLTTQRSSVGDSRLMVGWVQVQPTIWVMAQARWVIRLALSTLAQVAPRVRSARALRTRARCWTTRWSSVGVTVVTENLDMKIRTMLGTFWARWATTLQQFLSALVAQR